MNKSYKSVWNASAGTFVAAPETAKSHCGAGTASSSTISSNRETADRPATALKAAFMPIAMAIGMVSLPGMAWSQDVAGNGGLTLCPGGGGGGTGTVIGIDGSATANCFSAGGVESTSMSFGLTNGTGGHGEGTGLGYGNAYVVGYGNGHLDLGGTAGIGMYNDVNMRNNKIYNLAAGIDDTDAVNVSQIKGLTQAVGGGAAVAGNGSITNPTYTFDDGTLTYNNAGDAFNLIAGRIKYFHVNSTAAMSTAAGNQAIGIGPVASAAGDNSIALGNTAVSTGSGSIAIGSKATALVSNSVALGANSVAARNNSVSVGAQGSERQIINVAPGSAGTDAVNVNQLNAAIASVPGFDSVQYDTSVHNSVTFGGAGRTAPVKLANVADGVANNDAVNVEQLKAMGANIDTSGNVTGAFVAYDNAAKSKVTLGGTSATTAVALSNVAAGQLTSTSSDAVNGSQLYGAAKSVAAALGGGTTVNANGTLAGPAYALNGTTYNDVGSALAAVNAKTGSGSVDGVVYDTSAHNKVTFGGVGSKTPVTLSNVADGVANNDAVNVEQLKAMGANIDSSGNVMGAFVAYDNSAKSKVTLGGTGATTAVGLTNVAAGQVTSTSKDAVNGSQLFGTANSVAAALGGGTAVNPNGTLSAPAYALDGTTYNDVGSALNAMGSAIDGINGSISSTTKYIKVVSVSSAAIASGAEAVAIGGGAYASGTGSLALGSGARSQFADSVAIGSNSTTSAVNTISVGSKGAERRIMNVANGVAATDVATYAQLTALQTSVTQQLSQQSSGVKSMLLGATPVTNYIAVSSNVTAGGSTSTDNAQDAMAIGPTATALGQGSLAVGAGSGTALAGSTAVGNMAAALAANTTAIGAGASTNGTATNSVAIGYNANAQGANALSLGSGSQTNAANSVAMGSNAFVMTAGTNSMALGSGATASQANSVALGTNSSADRANTISVGSSTAQRQVVNMAAGTAGTDAVNVNQLTGVTNMIGGGAGVNADGTIKKPAFTVGGQTFTDVGSALAAVTTGASGNSVQYDTSSHTKVTLGGVGSTTPVTVSNVAAGKADNDAVNMQQLKAMGGTVDSSGNLTNAFVAYDDTTKNSITLKGASGSTKITGLTAGALSASSTDAVNGAQLYSTNQNVANVAGNLINVTNTVNNITNGGGVKYFHANSTLADSSATGTDAVAIGGNAKATATNSVALGANSVADRSNTVSVGASGSERQVVNVAAGSADTDAVNVKQLKAMGANVDSSGNVTGTFVSYDNSAMSSITLKGASGTKISGVAAGTLSASSTDAVNGAQLYSTNQNVANMAGNVINVTNTVNNITNGGGVKYFHANSTLADSSATGTDAVAIGGNAKATANNSVALGSNSVASRANTVDVGSRQITDLAAGTQSTDAINLGQLQAMGANVDSSGNLTNAFVTYDDTTKNSITLKGASGSTKISGLTAGTLSASSTDAVNGTQLYSTNQNVANMAGNLINVTNTVNNITNGGGIKYFHANSTLTDSLATGTNAVAIGGNAKATANNSVALGANSTTVSNLSAAAYLSATGTLSGTTPAGEVSVGASGQERRLTNVAAGAAATDAVNVSQLQAAVTTASSTASANAVQYDSSSHNKVTLGGAGSSTPVALGNLAAGTVTSTSTDAVNGSQLYSTANSMAAALGGGSSVSPTGTVTNPTYKLSGGTYNDVGSALAGIDGEVSSINNTITNTTKYIKVVSASSAAIASGGEAVAIGGGAYASGLSSLAIGAGARAQFADSMALGSNSVTSAVNTISVGSKGAERRIMNVANGVANTDVATFGQLSALQATVSQLSVQSSGVKSMLLGGPQLLGASASLDNYIAVSSNITAGAPAASTDNSLNAMAIGPMASTMGENSLAIGAGSGTFHDGSTAVGSQAVAGSAYTTVIGAGASTNSKADYAVAIGYMANAQGTDALSLGSNSLTNAANSIAIGSDSYVLSTGTNSIALGSGSTASAANSVALGANSTADRANTVSVGASGSVRQIVNVMAGSEDTDAVNVKQLNTAIATVSGGGSPNAVIYDSSKHDKVTFGNTGTPVALTNVAAGQIKSSSTDAVNGAQLYGTAASVAAALGGNSTVDANGNVVKPAYALDGTTYSDVGAALAAVDAKAGSGSTNGVAYDTSARDKVTLGGVGTSKLVTVSNVADGVANNDAVNVKQLKAMGANIDSSGNVMGAFVAYDDTSKGKVTLGGNGATTPVALSNVAAGQISSNSKDAVNGSQLYGTAASVAAALGGSTTVGSDGKVSKPSYSVNGDTYNDVGSAINAVSSLATTGSTLGVVYDSSARDKLTLGGSGATTPVEVSNVAAATADNDAVNLKQLKDAGLNVDTAGNVTNSFVAYDNASKGTVTFGGLGSTTPVQLKNVAAASDLTDAVNFGQMQTYVAQNAGSGGGTANAVAYDDSTKSKVTLGGAGSMTPVTLTNVAAGSSATDAVNYSQFSSLQNQVNNLSGGGTGDTTYVNINTPSTGGTAASASGTDAIAIGNGAIASGTAAIAIGKDAVTAGDNSVALGQGASAPNTNAVALGSNSTTDRDNSVSVGSAGNERQITNVAAGTQATDAVNLGQLNNAMGGMQQSINNVDRSAAKGIASASALNIVTPYLPGRTTLNAGVANYRGYQAIGLGVSRWNEKGTINYNLGVSSSGGNSTIVRAGIGIVLGN
ncbi:YadA-like family protein [Paraburkholderia domus]|uniref:YadA-like family protein n=1 Tax=Paraburkholderia domus TaxID=2793075 RepID=UPI001913AA47|nr:YadA-like family protein [Paraburkholderia domus]MBK5061074.1 YadA-like family protein [Burkholderia sp. R-70199]CAE6882452.1 hypothetical protein R70199_02609 [Paraburkholderia domus]